MLISLVLYGQALSSHCRLLDMDASGAAGSHSCCSLITLMVASVDSF